MTSYALLAGLLLLTPAEGADKTETAGKKFFDALVGQWEGAKGLATDWPGVGKQGDVLPASGTESPILGGKAVECDLRIGPMRGKILRVWDPASRSIRSLGITTQGEVYRQTLVPDGAAWAGKDSFQGLDGRWTWDCARAFTKSGQLQTLIGTNQLHNGKSVPDSWEIYRRGPLPKMSREAFQALDDLVGEWQFEGTVGTKPYRGSYVYAWGPGRAFVTFKGTDDGPGDSGGGVIGWDPARKQIVQQDHWTPGWTNRYTLVPKGPALLEGTGEAPTADGRPTTVRVTWEFPEPGRYVYRWHDRVGKDGRREEEITERARKVQPAGAAFQPPQILKDYARAYVGEWQGQVTPAGAPGGEGAKAPRVPGRTTCRWILDGAALEWTGQVGDLQFLGLVYADPESKQLRAAGAGSNGLVSEHVLTRDKDAWVNRLTQVSPDGKKTESSITTTFQGPDQHTNSGNEPEVWKRVKK